MATHIEVGGILADLVRKDIKHIYLRVLPPDGRVRISAPKRMSLEAIRRFAHSKRHWITTQQAKLRQQSRETRRDYVDGERFDVWGNPHLLTVEQAVGRTSVKLAPGRLILRVKPGTDAAKREAMLEAWYRRQVQHAVPALLARWEPRLGVKVKRFSVRRMKTRWGSCTPKTRTIRLNTELAKKPAQFLEFIVVHEMMHLLEPTHNARYKALMDKHLPQWRALRKRLNKPPM